MESLNNLVFVFGYVVYVLGLKSLFFLVRVMRQYTYIDFAFDQQLRLENYCTFTTVSAPF